MTLSRGMVVRFNSISMVHKTPEFEGIEKDVKKYEVTA